MKTPLEPLPCDSSALQFTAALAETALSELSPAEIDRQYFIDYFEVYGDQAFAMLIDKIRKFLEILPGRIESMQSAIRQSDHEKIFHAAHMLKTSAAYAGGKDLSAVFEALEYESRRQSAERYPILLTRLLLETRRLQLSLNLEIEYYTNQMEMSLLKSARNTA